MKMIALEKEIPGVTPGQFSAYLKAEAARVWELYQSGVVRELYFRADRSEAVLVLECASMEEAHAALRSLPLVKKGLIDFDLVPLTPYPGFARLFEKATLIKEAKPSTYLARPFAGLQDIQLIKNLILASRPGENVADYPGIGELDELLAVGDLQACTRLWFDSSDHLAGYAWLDSYDNLHFECLPGQDKELLEEKILNWLESTAHQQGRTVLDASDRIGGADRSAFLERHGYQQLDEHILHFARSLHAPIAKPLLPPGFTIRPMEVEEIEHWVELHHAAFQSDKMTLEYRTAMIHAPDYDRMLDLVVTEPSGQMVGFCVCSINHLQNRLTGRNDGFTDPVGVHPDYRNRGLSVALLLSGLDILKRRGMDAARLGTTNKNIPMQAAARSVGFKVEFTTNWYRKSLA
jgi:ribosomal protein S18 acetylase RimI-like enzyme/muconolactone delta-isomerase